MTDAVKLPNPPLKPRAIELPLPKGRINWEALDEETAKKLRLENGFRQETNQRKVKV